ncbi:MAG: hypothetical protein GY787_22005 [Alteromonadales bacterium]|nr:hypothetical protein [Alteromonadales bacterium]
MMGHQWLKYLLLSVTSFTAGHFLFVGETEMVKQTEKIVVKSVASDVMLERCATSLNNHKGNDTQQVVANKQSRLNELIFDFKPPTNEPYSITEVESALLFDEVGANAKFEKIDSYLSESPNKVSIEFITHLYNESLLLSPLMQQQVVGLLRERIDYHRLENNEQYQQVIVDGLLQFKNSTDIQMRELVVRSLGDIAEFNETAKSSLTYFENDPANYLRDLAGSYAQLNDDIE